MRMLKTGELKAAPQRVDREAGMIFGASVIEKGPALGHGHMVDGTFLDQVAEMGAGKKTGIKVRLGHPNGSDDALGQTVGKALNFRREDDRVLADLKLNDSAEVSPNGDMREFMLRKAEGEPEDFAMSIAFNGETVFRDADGTQFTPDEFEELDAEDRAAFARVWDLETLIAADFVDEAAANTGGLFGESLSVYGNGELAAYMTGLLDKLSEREDFPERMAAFCERYLRNQGKETPHMSQGEETDERVTALESENKELREKLERSEFDALLGRYEVDPAGELAKSLEGLGTEKAEAILKAMPNEVTETQSNLPPVTVTGTKPEDDKVDLEASKKALFDAKVRRYENDLGKAGAIARAKAEMEGEG